MLWECLFYAVYHKLLYYALILFLYYSKKQKKVEESKVNEEKKKKLPEKEADNKGEELSVSLLKIQIGLIRKAWKHPSADRWDH